MAFRLARIALRFRWSTLTLIVAVTIAAALGLPKLESQSYLESGLPKGDAERRLYDTLQQEFGSDRIAVMVIGCDAPRPCGSVLEEAPLSLIRALSDLSAEFQQIDLVQSLSTVGVLVGDGTELVSKTLPRNANSHEIEQFGLLVSNDPTLFGNLVSRDFRTTAVISHFNPQIGDGERNRVALQLLERATELADRSGFQLYVSGDMPFAAISDKYVRQDLKYLTPVMVVFLIVLLSVMLVSVSSVLIALSTVLIPAIWVFGLMGWLGVPLTPVSSMLPILILVIGVTDSMHLLVRTRELSRFRPVSVAVVDVTKEIGPPTTMTAITGSLGFLSLLTGHIPAVGYFGVFASFGIVSAWILTFSLAPICMIGTQPSAVMPSAFEVGDTALLSIRAFTSKRSKSILWGALLLLAVSTVGIFNLVPENDSLKIIGAGDYLIKSKRFIEQRLRPTASVEVIYTADRPRAIFEPDTIDLLQRMEAILKQRDPELPVISILPVMRIANRELTNSGLDVPETRELAAQLTLLAELAAGERMRRIVSPDHVVVRMSVPYAWNSSDQVQGDLREIRRKMRETVGDHGSVEVTGNVFLAAHMGSLVLKTQISTFSTAFITIFVVIVVFIRSLRIGIVGMIPNVFPVIVVLGLMGLTDTNLDVATSMIASIVLGVSVDDTLYFITHYKTARSRGASVPDAIGFTFSVAGKPAMFSGLVLSTGFFVLGFSNFQSLSIFGLLSGLAVLLATGSELLLMPAVLHWIGQRA